MLSILDALTFAALVGSSLAFAWELRNRRIVPPLRIERASHPRWYWLLIVVHAALLGLMGLALVFLLLLGLVSDLSN